MKNISKDHKPKNRKTPIVTTKIPKTNIYLAFQP